MSEFLGFESYLIPLGSTVQNVQDTFRTAITSYGWQCINQSIAPEDILGTITTPSYALDMESNTGASGNIPIWLGVKMTTAFTPVTMFLQGISTMSFAWPATQYCPKTFTLDWSDNGSSWTTHQTWSNENNWIAKGEIRKYAITSAPAKNYWRINVTANMSGTTTYIHTWMLEDSNKQCISKYNWIDVIPPVTETIGNSNSLDRLKMVFDTTSIKFYSCQETLVDIPQFITFTTATAGAVTLSITINGVTVSYTGIAGNSTKTNARELFIAAKSSTDSNFLAWDWLWWNALIATTDPALMFFRAVSKVASPNIVSVTSSNIVTRYHGTYLKAMPLLGQVSAAPVCALTTDMINGFIYYLQVTSRGLAIAIKTNSAFYGPTHACYGDNESALLQIPTSVIPGIPCTPIELLIGQDDQASTNTGATANLGHWWGVPISKASETYIIANSDASFPYCITSKMTVPGIVLDYSTLGTTVNCTLRGEGIFNGADSGQAYAVHRLSSDPDVQWVNDYGGYVRMVGPVYNMLDWYRYTGTLSNEQLVFSPSNDFTTTLTAGVGPTDTTLLVDSTTGWPTAGFIYADSGEVIGYAGVTSTSFTGCTRARYGTAASSMFTDDTVSIGCWFVKINYGLLLAGYTKPV